MILLFGKFTRQSSGSYCSSSYELHGGKVTASDKLEANVGLPVLSSGEPIGRLHIELEAGRFKAIFTGANPAKSLCVVVYRLGSQRLLKCVSATSSAMLVEAPA